jgi:hypothetical protein
MLLSEPQQRPASTPVKVIRKSKQQKTQRPLLVGQLEDILVKGLEIAA